jgi:hypothetical protein
MALALFLTVASLAAGDDDEILKDLEFFKSFHLVKNLDVIKESPGSDENQNQPLSTKIEVKNEIH